MAKSKKSNGKKRSVLGSAGTLLKTVFIGFGAGSVGSIIADRTGLNPMIPSAALGFLAGGVTPALVAVVSGLLRGSLGTGASQSAPMGQVVWA